MERGAAAGALAGGERSPLPETLSPPASSAWPRALKRGPAACRQFFETRSVPAPKLDGPLSSTRSGFKAWAEARLSTSPTTTKALWSWPCWGVCKNPPRHGRPLVQAASRGLPPHQPLAVRPTLGGLLAGWNPWRSHARGGKARPGQPRSSAAPCLRPSPISPEPSAARTREPARKAYRSLPIAI